MVQKYIIRDFHPLVLFYTFGVFLILVNIPLVARIFLLWGLDGNIPPINTMLVMLNSILGFQSLLFAMLFDMEANRELKGKDAGDGIHTRA